MKFASRLVNFDAAPQDAYRPMSTPIYQTATFEQLEADAFGQYDYSRSGNPTRKVLEDQLAALENGTRGFCFSSGMAAIMTVTHLLKAGDEILADWDLYGGASRLFGRVLQRSGVTVRYVDASDAQVVAAAMTPETRLVYAESPTNPLLRVLDLQAIAKIAHAGGALFCVDNSTMSPYLQNPLDLGADIVVHSATKFICGHSDVTGGAIVVKDEALATEIYFLQNAEGTALGPFDCFLLLRGLKTLKIRLDAQQKNAMQIAHFLAGHDAVAGVFYPGLSDHPNFAVQQQQARGAGSILSFRAGSAAAAKRIAEQSELFRISVSFGSVNSTISVPVKMSHASVPAELRDARALPEDLLRLSIGIEDVDDLIADLDRLLRANAGFPYNLFMSVAATITLPQIQRTIRDGGRIDRHEARWLWQNASDADLRELAMQVRSRFHAADACTYMIMRIINYTNVCVAQCDYCAFYRLPGQEGGYVMKQDEVFAKLDELLALGGDLAAFNGGFNPHLPLSYYCDLFRAIRDRYGDRLEFYALTIAEFMYLADHAKLDYATAAQQFKDAGVRWITGGGSEILTEDFRRRHSKFKYTVAQYFEAQRAIVDAGLRTTATMVIGFDETLEERLEHLERTRRFQDETGGLASFLCWTYKPYFTQIGGIEIGTGEYLRHLALSRIFLDNVPRIRTSVLTQNERALEGLAYGADDFDLPIEDEVTQKAGATINLAFDRILDVARELGFQPQYRHVASASIAMPANR